MNTLDYLDMVVNPSASTQRLAAANDGPKSDCCIARLVPVGDEMYACEACGGLCSDGTLSMP